MNLSTQAATPSPWPPFVKPSPSGNATREATFCAQFGLGAPELTSGEVGFKVACPMILTRFLRGSSMRTLFRRLNGRRSSLIGLGSLVCALAVGGASCNNQKTVKELQLERSQPAQICVEPQRDNCKSVEEVESLLRASDLEILEATMTPGGQQGARLLSLRSGDVVFRAKWRARDEKATLLSHLSNSRRTAVSYAVQKLFLDDDQIVIPPTVGYCFPLSHYKKRVDREAKVSITDPACVFGYLSYWLPDVETAKEAEVSEEKGLFGTGYLYSEERFGRERHYASKLARMNALTFIVEHGDPHGEQFLVQFEPFHVWSVDHSVSMTSVKNPLSYFEEDWSNLIVPSFPRELAEKLRSITAEDISKLATIETYARVDDRLVPRAYRKGMSKLQPWGATAKERELLESKLRELVTRLDDGSLGVFNDKPHSRE